jgi:hypothetical protein
MEHKPLSDLSNVADLVPETPKASLTRRERLERWIQRRRVVPGIVGSDGLHLAAMRLAMSPAGISPRACTSRTSFITGGETPKAAISCGTRRKALDPSA